MGNFEYGFVFLPFQRVRKLFSQNIKKKCAADRHRGIVLFFVTPAARQCTSCERFGSIQPFTGVQYFTAGFHMSALLDAQEFLQLANHYTQKEEYAQGLKLVKEGLIAYPDDSKLLYLLGALHAQLGLYEEAKQEMARAVSMNPQLHTAHFQLGLLHWSSADFAQARQAWQALEALPAKHPLQLFHQGLLALIEDQFERCTELLREGMAQNQALPALNTDMQQVIDAIAQQEVLPPEDEPAKALNTSQFFLANYRKPPKH